MNSWSLNQYSKKSYVLKFSREKQSVDLPPLGQYATGIFYMDKLHHTESEATFTKLAEHYKLRVKHL
jgi:hypothetical protein